MLNPVRCKRCTQITKCKLISQALAVVGALRWRQHTIDWPWPPKTYVSMWVLLIIACSSCSRFTHDARKIIHTFSFTHITYAFAVRVWFDRHTIGVWVVIDCTWFTIRASTQGNPPNPIAVISRDTHSESSPLWCARTARRHQTPFGRS